ncbi:MAG: hypothetical protein IJG59_04640 [Erysipelotrichaceae bacterium]|nr:hypothetical protein [Erysipelotrichaceae bacterium]
MMKMREFDFENTVKGPDGLGDKAVVNDSGLKAFYYSFRNSFGDGSYSCEIVRKESDEAVISYETFDHSDYGTMEITVNDDILNTLYQLYLKYQAARWSGYSKYDEGVLDGSGFSLSMEFNDGDTMSCSGENCVPEGYREYEKEMREVLKPYFQQLLDRERDRQIAKGIDGELRTAMINYIGNKFGTDRFEMLIHHYNGKNRNFDVRISSRTGEFIAKGKYNYYYMLPDEDIGFENIKALIEKYNVISWYDWNKASANPYEDEWFQLGFDFGSMSIQAMGTEHPENYDEFRRELLQYIVEVIRKAEVKYDDFRSR